jgi:HAD superfamily phosphatase (TIGR01668 family)
VTVIEGARALSKDDPEAAAVVLAALRAEGIAIHEGAAVTRVSGRAGAIAVETDAGARFEGTHLLVAVGRKATIERLNLKAAGIAVALLSNGTRVRVAALGVDLGVPAFALSGKPFGFAFRRGLRALGSDARHTAMVGDQLFTDVLGANCAGLISILVTPLSPGRHAHTRAARRIERWVLSGGGHGRPVDR